MRGLLSDDAYTRGRPRITPAHAGLTILPCPARPNYRDHPRACGAYKRQQMIDEQVQGSPPRMRGLLYTSIDGKAKLGITPAHAGLTIVHDECDKNIWDHPRACGAYIRTRYGQTQDSGSPPRMRGLPYMKHYG